MSTNTSEQLAHFEDEDFPGWCGVCGGAYPCPGTATAEEQARIMARFAGGL